MQIVCWTGQRAPHAAVEWRCRAGLFSLHHCSPASPPPTSTAASDLESVTCAGRSAPSPPPSNDATKETIIEKKIDFKQTIIDFQEKTILTSLTKTDRSERNSRRDMCDWITRHHHRLPPDSPRYQLDQSVHLRIGALVSARYSDDRWYRARIIAIYQSKGLLFLCCRNSLEG